MNHKFRLKPTEIEAFQITKESRADNRNWPQWLNEAWNKNFAEDFAVSSAEYPNSKGDDQLVIRTLERGGYDYVGWGGWIVRDVDGKLSICADSTFRAAYDPVAEDNFATRLRAEAADLEARLTKLSEFIGTPAYYKLPPEDWSLLEQQAYLMHELLQVLKQRVDRLPAPADT